MANPSPLSRQTPSSQSQSQNPLDHSSAPTPTPSESQQPPLPSINTSTPSPPSSSNNPLASPNISRSTAARRNRPPDPDPMDTQRRINYRPTALPLSHHRNDEDDDAGGRWLSEDEGSGPSRHNRGGSGSGQGMMRRVVANRGIVTPPNSSGATGLNLGDMGSEEGNRLQRAAWGESGETAGVAGGGEQSGLEAAKAQWKAMGAKRNRLRRTLSQETSPVASSSARLGPSADNVNATAGEAGSVRADAAVGASGHPIAAHAGLPMPEIRALAPLPRLPTGGVSTFQAEMQARPTASSSSSSISATADVPQPQGGPSTRQPVRLTATASSSSFAEGIQSISLTGGDVPDFAAGRGGDGIGGFDMPAKGVQTIERENQDIDVREREAQQLEQKQQRIEMANKLSGILKCPCCPSDIHGRNPYLYYPVTLHCGHTISSAHVNIPKVPVPDLSRYPPTDVYGIMAAYHARRLTLWSKISCPLPFCRSHRRSVSSASQTSDTPPNVGGGMASSSGAQRALLQAQGVEYYPMPPDDGDDENRPAHSRCPNEADAAILEKLGNTDKTLSDISVAKVLALVVRQIEADSWQQPLSQHISGDSQDQDEGEETEGDADNEDESGPATSGKKPAHRAVSDAMDAAPTLSRSSSKRRRTASMRQVEPSMPPFKRAPHSDIGDVDAMRPALGVRRSTADFEKELMGVLECDVCAQLLYEPVTTPCQHTFCSKCLARSLDHSTKCPLCRQDLPSFAYFQDHAVNKVLTSIIMTAFPKEFAERKRAIEDDERDNRLDTPIFICTLAFPGMPTILHVFEPRYRLMLRRCVESGTPRFGMVLPARGAGNPGLAGVLEYGTMLDIRSIQMLPDGRSMVETMGSYRFRLLEKGSMDGYTVGRVERIDDISPEDEDALERLSIQRARNAAARAEAVGPSTATASATAAEQAESSQAGPSRPVLHRSLSTSGPGVGSGSSVGSSANPPPAIEAEPTTAELMATCHDFIEHLRSGSAPWLLQRLNHAYGPMPDDPTTFSYWMALVMPIDEYEKARLLPIRSHRLRLKLIVHWVEQLRSSWCFPIVCGVARLTRNRFSSGRHATPAEVPDGEDNDDEDEDEDYEEEDDEEGEQGGYDTGSEGSDESMGMADDREHGS